MRLGLHTDYALRTLIYLAGKPGRTSVAEGSAVYPISKDHCAKVVQFLARAGDSGTGPGPAVGAQVFAGLSHRVSHPGRRVRRTATPPAATHPRRSPGPAVLAADVPALDERGIPTKPPGRATLSRPGQDLLPQVLAARLPTTRVVSAGRRLWRGNRARHPTPAPHLSQIRPDQSRPEPTTPATNPLLIEEVPGLSHLPPNPPNRLCKPEVTGSIPVRSIGVNRLKSTG